MRLLHELMHSFAGWTDHTSAGDHVTELTADQGMCTMRNGSIIGSLGTGFCRSEYLEVWPANTLKAFYDVDTISSSGANPRTSTWGGASFLDSAGHAGFDFWRHTFGSTGNYITLTDILSSPDRGVMWSSQYTDSLSAGSLGTANVALQRPVYAYDFVHDRLWIFFRPNSSTDPWSIKYRIASSTVSNVPAFGNTFTITDSSGVAAQSYFPTGATYDPKRDRMVVMFTDLNPGSTASGLKLAKSRTLSVLSIPAATTTGGNWSTKTVIAGGTAIGPPAIACENSSTTYNCQALVTGTDVGRNIWSVPFGLDTAGLAVVGSGPNTGGQTPYGIGLTFNGEAGTAGLGHITAVVVGTDHNLYLNSRKDMATSWAGWMGLGFAADPGSPRVRISHIGSTNYQILFPESQ